MTALAEAARHSRHYQRQKPDKRRHHRVSLALDGKFLFENNDHILKTVNISCGGARLQSQTTPPEGTSIVCYFDDLGRLSAEVVRPTDGGFAVKFTSGPRKRDKLADRLVWLLNAKRYQLEDERAAPRKASASMAMITLSDGRRLQCRVIDISLTGAAFENTGPPLKIGDVVKAGKIEGEIVRSDPDGFAIRFLKNPKT